MATFLKLVFLQSSSLRSKLYVCPVTQVKIFVVKPRDITNKLDCTNLVIRIGNGEVLVYFV